MHETGVVQGLLNAALDSATHHESSRVHRLRIVIGAASGVTEEAVRFIFGVVSRGTAAEGAELLIRFERPEVVCRDCGLGGDSFLPPRCPGCGGGNLEVRSGHACYVESIDVDDPNGGATH